MKPGIHPTWYPDAVVTCACGNTWTTGSTKKEIHTDVCSACHPFFTGEQRIVDTAGQVERFMKRISAKEHIAATQPPIEEKKAKKARRSQKATPVEEAPAPRPPRELPLADAQAAQMPETTMAPDPLATEVAPLVEPENYRPEHREVIAPAGEIGSAASVDKIIEPTGEGAKPRASRRQRKPRGEAKPEGTAAEPTKPQEEPTQE